MQIIARARHNTDFRILSVSEYLRVSPEALSKYLLVTRGTSVEAGMPLARKRSPLGTRSFVSPVDGRVYAIRSGRIVLQRSSGWLELRAMVQGRVINLVPNRGVVIEVEASLIQGAWGSGKDGFGELMLMADSPMSLFTADQVTLDMADKILAVGRISDPEILTRADIIGVRGIIAGSITGAVCETAETIAYPVIATEGIGDLGMAEPIFQLLQQAGDNEASLFATAPNKWGNRPEIIIPSTKIATGDPPPVRMPLSVGQTVRLLRAPYRSQVGEVVKLYRHPQRTVVGIKAHGADVKLANGNIVFVPYVNLDAIV